MDAFAAFRNKPAVRQETDLVYRRKSTFYNIFTNVVHGGLFCWHYKLQARSMPVCYSGYIDTSGQDTEKGHALDVLKSHEENGLIKKGLITGMDRG